MKINLYSTNCPKCKILEKKLSTKNIEYDKVTDFDPETLLAKGFTSVPVLEVDNEFYDFKDSINYINAIK